MKKFLFLLLCCGLWTGIWAQTTLTVQVSIASDDLEEYIPSPNQTQTVGSVDAGSSDLELGNEAAGNVDPMVIGIRFTGISIPKGSLITRAYLQFQVDNTTKNTDPCNVWIKAQADDNPLTFASVTFNISSRLTLNDSVYWAIPNGSWNVIGDAGADQRSTNIAQLVQALVNRQGWTSGNAMAFLLTGTGLREAESFDGSPAGAPKLIIEYIPVTSLTAQVSTPEDDLEEYLPGANQTQTVGSLDAGSSDLELGNEAAGNIDPMVIGIRFANLAIPKGAKIQSARLQFQVDNTNKNTDPCVMWIKAQDAATPTSFTTTPFDITSRIQLPDSVNWPIPVGSWNVIGQADADQTSTDIASLVQALVDRDDWTTGSAMAFMLTGTGLREAESFDGSPAGAAKLLVDFIPVATLTTQVSAAEDDMEEYLPGANQTQTVGNLDAGSSDLELGNEASGNLDPQVVGVRFNGVNLPQGAVISRAYLQFQVDNTNKNTDPCNIWIKGQDADNPPSFTTTPFDITSRFTLNDSVYWAIPAGSWNVIGQNGDDQASTDITSLVQSLVSRSGWTNGNAMVFTLGGTGLREAESFDGSPAGAPKLVVEYLSGGSTGPTGNPTTAYPVSKDGSWSYDDSGVFPGVMWTQLTFNDSLWPFSQAPLGYGLGDLNTEISFGTDPNNKHISTYFRKRLNIDLSSLPDPVEMQVRSDDGLIVYVNEQEVLRRNMPVTVVNPTTLASSEINGNREYAYFTYEIPKSFFTDGTNIIAAQVHQHSANSADLVFDLSLINPIGLSNTTDLGCIDVNDTHIGCFTSLIPREQRDTLEIPSTHAFQYIVFDDENYTIGSGGIPGTFDFTGYVPANGTNSRAGHIALNHEETIGGVSVFDVSLDFPTGLWQVDSSGSVDFSVVAGTQRNCSGTVTPWGTVISSEETFPTSGDANGDGYIDLGWNVEIDPITRQVRNYGNGPAKLWAMGRMSHENVVVASDNKIVYQGEDASNGAVYKFVADVATNLSSGKLYVLKLNQPLVGFEPTGSNATWIEVPNTTPTERNNVKLFANDNGTTFTGVEDVEISPLDGKVYFAVKGAGRVYRFQDNGTTVSDFETFVGGQSYRITSGDEVVTENWNLGIDNLTFDERGNLWALQDGGRNHIWIVRPNHSQSIPKVEVFLQTPIGSEPTGMTFTPDHRYMFLSIQSPSSANNTLQSDISGRSEKLNRNVMLAIARREYLGTEQMVAVNDPALRDQLVKIYPNPFSDITNIAFELVQSADVRVEMFDQTGRLVRTLCDSRLPEGQHLLNFETEQAGIYFCRMIVNGSTSVSKLIKQ